MIRAIAVDDEPVALDIIRMHVAKIPFITLPATFVNAREALLYMNQHQADLVFMDISMPDISGLEMADRIKHQAQVIFTTAYAGHALKGFELAATDYLLKPINFNRFLQACELAQSRLHTVNAAGNSAGSLFVKDGHNWIQIQFHHILYAQAQDNYICIHEASRRTLTRMTLSELQDKLPSHTFMRIHKSYIISVNSIEMTEKKYVQIGGIKIPVSAGAKSNLLQLIANR